MKGGCKRGRALNVLLLSLLIPTHPAKGAPPILGQQAREIGTEAYIYGYPLVTMEMTRRVMTNVAVPTGTRGPMGQFHNMRRYPDASFHDVTAANADTLYSVAWLDLSKEPYVLSIPDAHDRYYLMPLLSAWTNVFEDPGKRTTGTRAQTYAITGPNWMPGPLPAGVTRYKSPTNLVWILGRTYCTGTPRDYQDVHAFQNRLGLVPLSKYGKPYTPPRGTVDPTIDMKTPVRDQVNRMDASAYFKLMAELMKSNRPAPEDAPIVNRMAKIGLIPGRDFDIGKLDPAIADELRAAPKAALERIVQHRNSVGTSINGWSIATKNMGTYGTAYLDRAAVAMIGLGANLPQDAVYPMSEMDENGQPYIGTNHYLLHFAKGELPPVKGFWSLTMYDPDYFFVPNSLNRYTLSERNQLKYNPDGSVDLYLQSGNPGPEHASNWLPAPRGKFVLCLRLYWPNEQPPSILDGTWKPPAVQKVE
jgi:hypothetical protein